MNILIIVAMSKEALPVIEMLDMKPAEKQLDARLNTTLYYTQNPHNIYLTTSGQDSLHKTDRLGSGIIPATILAIQSTQPDLIINLGSAGGYSQRGAARGDIYLSQESFKFHDRLFGPDLYHGPYGIGSYLAHSVDHIAQHLSLKQGIISTGGSMLASVEEKIQITQNQAVLKDMEAAHIAQVAHLFDIPMFAIKGVTDLVDIEECPQEQFSAHIQDLSLSLAKTLKDILLLLE